MAEVITLGTLVITSVYLLLIHSFTSNLGLIAHADVGFDA